MIDKVQDTSDSEVWYSFVVSEVTYPAHIFTAALSFRWKLKHLLSSSPTSTEEICNRTPCDIFDLQSSYERKGSVLASLAVPGAFNIGNTQ